MKEYVGILLCCSTLRFWSFTAVVEVALVEQVRTLHWETSQATGQKKKKKKEYLQKEKER